MRKDRDEQNMLKERQRKIEKIKTVRVLELDRFIRRARSNTERTKNSRERTEKKWRHANKTFFWIDDDRVARAHEKKKWIFLSFFLFDSLKFETFFSRLHKLWIVQSNKNENWRRKKSESKQKKVFFFFASYFCWSLCFVLRFFFISRAVTHSATNKYYWKTLSIRLNAIPLVFLIPSIWSHFPCILISLFLYRFFHCILFFCHSLFYFLTFFFVVISSFQFDFDLVFFFPFCPRSWCVRFSIYVLWCSHRHTHTRWENVSRKYTRKSEREFRSEINENNLLIFYFRWFMFDFKKYLFVSSIYRSALQCGSSVSPFSFLFRFFFVVHCHLIEYKISHSKWDEFSVFICSFFGNFMCRLLS